MFGYENEACYMIGGFGLSDHKYSFVMMRDSRIIESTTYSSRNAATSHLYDLLAKFKSQVNKIYDDTHDKTYICSNGYECHINRAF